MQNDNVSDVNDSAASGDESQNNQKPVINPQDHARAVEDLKKFKARSKELETNFQKLQTELDEIRQSKLKEQNDFKSLYEQASTKNQEWESKYGKLKENIVYNEKYKAAQAALLKAGIRPEALKILEKEDLEPIIVEYTSEGRTNVLGADEYVDTFKKNYGFAFEDKTKARVNGGSGGAGNHDSGSITASKLYELEKKHGIKSEEYTKAIERYRKQKQG